MSLATSLALAAIKALRQSGAAHLDDWIERRQRLPEHPGVYAFILGRPHSGALSKTENWFERDSLLYIGVATNLRSRTDDHRPKWRAVLESQHWADPITPDYLNEHLVLHWTINDQSKELSNAFEAELIEHLRPAAQEPIISPGGFGGKYIKGQQWSFLGNLDVEGSPGFHERLSRVEGLEPDIFKDPVLAERLSVDSEYYLHEGFS